MAQAKRIYILMIKVKQVAFFVLVAEFSKRNREHILLVSVEL